MQQRVTPMIHVPDVAATVEFYRDIGFTVDATYGRDGEGFSFAVLSFGSTQVMFNQGGRPSTQKRREVDLYTYTEGVDALYDRLKDKAVVVEGPHETFYGMREVIIRDLNGFWITFGEESSFGKLMNGIQQGNVEMVQAVLSQGGLTELAMNQALLSVSSGENANPEIAELLKRAGAQLPPTVELSNLEAYTGHYKSDRGMEADILLKDGSLVAVPTGTEPITLIAIDEMTFRPMFLPGMTVYFHVVEGKITGFELSQGSEETLFTRHDSNL
jgi:catechol 2,3-dioxygenase-like lactoylglutathione lyase family enzyme